MEAAVVNEWLIVAYTVANRMAKEMRFLSCFRMVFRIFRIVEDGFNRLVNKKP